MVIGWLTFTCAGSEATFSSRRQTLRGHASTRQRQNSVSDEHVVEQTKSQPMEAQLLGTFATIHVRRVLIVWFTQGSDITRDSPNDIFGIIKKAKFKLQHFLLNKSLSKVTFEHWCSASVVTSLRINLWCWTICAVIKFIPERIHLIMSNHHVTDLRKNQTIKTASTWTR